MPEPERKPERIGLRELLPEPLRNRKFVRFLTFYVFFMIGCPGTIYYIWRNVTEQLEVSDFGAQMILVVIPVLGEMFFAPVWGRLIERVGRKTVWRISFFYVVFLPLFWLLVLRRYWWLGIVVTTLRNIFWNGADQGVVNWLFELSSGEQGSSSYQAVFALVTAVAGTLSGLLLGFMASLASSWHFQLGPFTFTNLLAVFGVASFIRAVAYLTLLPRVQDEARKPVSAAVRYAMVLISESIGNTLTYPVRLLRGTFDALIPERNDKDK
ncbi:MAG: MFS transporter [Kiritimatiellia bacterium]